jgi:hypothetical protein
MPLTTTIRRLAQLFADPAGPEDRPWGQILPAWQTPLQEYIDRYLQINIDRVEKYRTENNLPPVDEQDTQDMVDDLKEKHQSAIIHALYRGDPIPPEVLKDYPDLGALDYDEPTPIATKLTDLDMLQRPNHVYRGMAQAEYDSTVGAGKGVQSDRRWCFTSEGTCFATNPSSSAYYVFDSRTSPKVTGEPVYIVEVAADPELMHKDRDGYVKTKDPAGWIPPESVTRSWEINYNPDDDFYYIQQVG